MWPTLTIVMYHYVRDTARTRYPKIKALPTDGFAGQIRYIKRHYNVISGPQLMQAVADRGSLPPRPLLLTFDDGYLDHFRDVLPRLEREHLTGCFFPPANCILEHRVLDVNKIHFVLASVSDTQLLVDFILAQVDENRASHDLLPSEHYQRLAQSSRFDSAEVVFCKRMLQRELPLELRQAIVDELFRRHVSSDEASFARELYMTADHLRELHERGMYVGAHGYSHVWMNAISTQQQEREIDQSLAFLQSVGADTLRWMMCYPYGAYDESLLSILRARNCLIGLTTVVDLARLGDYDRLTLPRLDTNDLPRGANVEPNEWTVRAGD
jgi:peptidoglycan/xylan/chitin deacetylase (PgdA/CDA1 family)